MRGKFGTCNVYKRTSVDDGFGAVEDRLVLVQSGVACRKTRLSYEEATKLTGQGGRLLWRFSIDPVSGLSQDKHYVIRVEKEIM